METKELIERQIQKGAEILEQISTMRERPTRVMNVIAYPWTLEIYQISSKDEAKTLSSNM